jgi:PTS system fructose-specific IIC component
MAENKDKEPKICRLLKEKQIELELLGKSKKEIIEELAEVIGRSRKLKDKKAFVKAILEREKLGSTGIGGGIAIPHAKIKGARDFILAFGRKSEGMDFGALDGERTYLFFMLASPLENIGGHLKILSEISRIFKDRFVIERLKKAKDKKYILRVISSAERNTTPAAYNLPRLNIVSQLKGKY